MSTEQAAEHEERRLSPADVQNVRFTRGSMMRPGYTEVEVDRFLARVAQELARSIAERAELRDEAHALRDEVHALREQLVGATEVEVAAPEPPSDQAVRILASAQQTADAYVAEAEEFSRQMTAEARHQYEELTRQARENAGGIIQAAQEAAAKVGRGHGTPASSPEQATSEELQEQIAYLRAFGQATRTQLRAYLEALLADVEKEWGRADPAAVPLEPFRTPAQRSDTGAVERTGTTFVGNTAGEAAEVDVATAGARSS
jgi:DivIVA domain-containing protein